MATIYISLGSNINKQHNTRAGIAALKQAFGELILSSVYESEAVGFEGDAFYNMVIACQVDTSVHQANQILRDIEDVNGRDREWTEAAPWRNIEKCVCALATGRDSA
jgi:2-amino-4-hydroxy-6-hydroxymethyldihydropteridine diphosphokinase